MREIIRIVRNSIKITRNSIKITTRNHLLNKINPFHLLHPEMVAILHHLQLLEMVVTLLHLLAEHRELQALLLKHLNPEMTGKEAEVENLMRIRKTEAQATRKGKRNPLRGSLT